MITPTLSYLTLQIFILLFPLNLVALGDSKLIINVEEHGMIGDGIVDDGKALKNIINNISDSVPTEIIFLEHKTYRIKTGIHGYAFNLCNKKNIKINGNNSIFLIDPSIRMFNIQRANNILIQRMNIDFDPLPFSQGLIIELNALSRSIDVEIEEGYAIPNETKANFKNAKNLDPFFAIIWNYFDNKSTTKHLLIDRIQMLEKTSQANEIKKNYIRLFLDKKFNDYEEIIAGKSLIDLPIPDISHIITPGENAVIQYCADIRLENINLWSAPWFAYAIRYNLGSLNFKNVNILPKPNSTRRMSAWRDGFHLKGNSGKIIFDGCQILGTHDDAFNISTHFSTIQKVISEQEIVVKQNFPIQYVPWNSHGELIASDYHLKTKIGSSAILSKKETGNDSDWNVYSREAPLVTLKLKTPILGMKIGNVVWDATTANPSVEITNCATGNSCRFRSPHMRIYNTKFNSFVWFTIEEVEGPFPHDIEISKCIFNQGRGSNTEALRIDGTPFNGSLMSNEWSKNSLIRDFKFDNTVFDGDVIMHGVEGLTLIGNKFIRENSVFDLRDSKCETLKENIFLDNIEIIRK